jgi:hypothetical protein
MAVAGLDQGLGLGPGLNCKFWLIRRLRSSQARRS